MSTPRQFRDDYDPDQSAAHYPTPREIADQELDGEDLILTATALGWVGAGRRWGW